MDDTMIPPETIASDQIVRPFKVDRTTPAQLLAACNRVLCRIDEEVLASMPMDGPEEGELVFFPLEYNTPMAEIPRVLELRGLIPDCAAQMQVNADDPAFADEHPNGMQWGDNCYAFFSRFGGIRRVDVDRNDDRRSDNRWLAGRRK